MPSAGLVVARPTEGLDRMRALAAEMPVAFGDGFRTGRELAFALREPAPRLYAVGMGASGIVADFARSLVDSETRSELTVVRGPELPHAVDSRAHVLLTSYSGNTWETVRAYDAAGRSGAARTVLASGGALVAKAEADGVPILRVPPGLPPRSAIGHLLGGMMGLLDGLFPESNDARVARAVERVRGDVGRLGSPRGPAAALAEGIGDRLPFFYAEGSFSPLARRWGTQVEENAKRLAVFDEIPELFHNAIVGWDAVTKTEAQRFVAVLLEWSGADPTVRKSLRYLERLLRARGVRTLKVPLSPEDRLEALLGGIALGDLVSLFLAQRRHVDPLPVDAIGRLKAALGTKSGVA